MCFHSQTFQRVVTYEAVMRGLTWRMSTSGKEVVPVKELFGEQQVTVIPATTWQVVGDSDTYRKYDLISSKKHCSYYLIQAGLTLMLRTVK